MTERRGMSLIELLVVMTVSVMVVGLIAGTIQALSRAERAMEKHLLRGAALARLSDSFRRDVHAARAAESVEQDQATRLELMLDGGRKIEFEVHEDNVLRIARTMDGPLIQERYSLFGGGAARFEIDRGDGPTIVSIIFVLAGGGSRDGKPRELRVEAMMGRDHRFASRGS